MKWLIYLSLICLIFLINPPTAEAQGRRAVNPRPASAYPGGRINVRVYDGNRSGIIFHRPNNGTPVKKNPCFPYSCTGIGPEITNPNPRKESEKPTCYYNVDDVLFFEKEGSNCSYIRASSDNDARIAKRKQEHLTKEASKK